MGAFSDTVRRACDDFHARAAMVAIGTIHEASRRLIARSPIGMPETWKKKPPPGYVPGGFVSNWNLGVDGRDNTVTDATSIRVVNNLDRIPDKPFGHRYYVSNAQPYAWRLEMDGWSRQAPDGMVRLTALEFDSIVKVAEGRAGGTSVREYA